MTPADRDRSRTVMSRLPLVMLLCAVAIGIIGMHGLGSGPDSAEHAGHHAAPAIIMTADSTMGGIASLGAVAGDEAPPADDAGLLVLCLMVLTPGLALGAWLLATAALGGTWRLPRPEVRVVAAVDTAVLSPRFELRLTVLRI